MKWLDPTPETALPPDARLKRLVETITEATGKHPPIKNVEIEALADALRLAWEERTEPFPDPFRLVQLSARTLGDLGSTAMARQLLLFGSGLAVPATWEISGEHGLWILDVRHLFSGGGNPLELALFRGVTSAVVAMSEVWDGSAGRGMLGLRNLRQSVEILSGCPGPRAKRRQAALIRELLQALHFRLESLGPARGWRHVPDVIHLGGS